MTKVTRTTAGASLSFALLVGCATKSDVATYVVERRDLVHRVTAEGNLKAKTVTAVSVPSVARHGVRIAWMAPDGSRVHEGEVVARFDAAKMLRALDESSADHETGSHKIEKSRVESTNKVSRIQMNREVAGLELDAAKRYKKDDDELYTRVEIIESEIDGDLAADRKAHATAMLDVQKELKDTELDLLRIEQRKAQIKIDQANEGLAALDIRSPSEGLLSWVRDWRGELPQVGQQVWPGQPLGEIPALAEMKAEVFLLEADAGGLDVGQPATLVVEAHPDRPFEAKVARVDPVAKPRFRGSPVQYFGVELELEKSDPSIMKPGQRVTATVYLHSYQDVLVIPRQALMTDDDGPFVYVEEGGSFVERRVELEVQSTAFAVIMEGLDQGDRIALEPPDRTPSGPSPSTEEGPDTSAIDVAGS